ncbi:MAG TPA: cytochrome P450 [Pseudonocardia sp.]
MTTEGTAVAADYDPLDEQTLRDPYPLYQGFRQDKPIARADAFGGFWVITRYADVKAAAADTETYSSATGGITIPPFGNPVPFIPIEVDPPEHAGYRKPLQGWMSKGRMVALEHELRRIVDGVLAPLLARGHGDLAVELAEPVPSIVLARVLGLPEADWSRFMRLGHTIVDAGERSDLETAGAAVFELMAYLNEQIEQRRATPGEDMLSQIVHMRVGGRPMSDQEVLGAAFFLVEAGHETTVGAIGTMLLHLARHPEQRRRLIEDPELIGGAIEEALRFDPPIQNLARTLTRDVTLHGVHMKAGDRVLLCWGSANRDEQTFERADELIIDRKRNHHVTFGSGVHHCLGAPLARLEMRVVLEKVLEHMPEYRVENEDEVVVGGLIARRVKRMPVVW